MPLPANGSVSDRVKREWRLGTSRWPSVGVLGSMESTRDPVDDTDFEGGLLA